MGAQKDAGQLSLIKYSFSIFHIHKKINKRNNNISTNPYCYYIMFIAI